MMFRAPVPHRGCKRHPGGARALFAKMATGFLADARGKSISTLPTRLKTQSGTGLCGPATRQYNAWAGIAAVPVSVRHGLHASTRD
jgi:hypothetical protein